jgi:hypothetical protein
MSLLVQKRSRARISAPDQNPLIKARLVPGRQHLGFPRFSGQVDKGHAMTIRLSIDDHLHQDPSPVHGTAKG